jgi:hypothetical protein
MLKILRSIAFGVVLLAALFTILALNIYGIFALLYAATPAPIVVWTSFASKDFANAGVYVALIVFAFWWINRDLARQNCTRAEVWFIAALVYPWQAFSLRLVLKRTTGATKSIFWSTLWTLLWTSSVIALARVPLAVAAGLIDGSYLGPSWSTNISSLASSGLSMPIIKPAESPNILNELGSEHFAGTSPCVQSADGDGAAPQPCKSCS